MAAERLVGNGAEGHSAQVAAGRRFLESAASLHIDVSLMWGTLDPSGRFFHHVCLAVVGAGRTAMLFFSSPDSDATPLAFVPGHLTSEQMPAMDTAISGMETDSEGTGGANPRFGQFALADVPTHVVQHWALVKHACHHLKGLRTHPVSRGVTRRDTDHPQASADTRVVALVQGLLEPHETDAIKALVNAGFTRLGNLVYMRRTLPHRAGSERGGSSRRARVARSAPIATDFSWPAGTVLRRLSDIPESEHDSLLAVALERSYIDTQDCPELCGLRDVADVLDSHRSVGVFDPSLWWIIEVDGRPEGAMLFSVCPEQQTIELVYLGISPLLRGKGVGSAMLTMGLGDLLGRSETTVCCAVDTRNAPAMKLYKRAGFQEFSTRVPMVMGIR